MDFKNHSSVFLLTEIEYDCFIYYLDDEENGVDTAPKYPSIKIEKRQLGFFSSFDKAEQGMKNFIMEEKKRGDGREKYIYGFLIDEYELDTIFDSYPDFCTKNSRNYLHDGSFCWDDSIDPDMIDSDDNFEEFFGRPEDKICFSNGELVEFLKNDTVKLGIVCNLPNDNYHICWVSENDYHDFYDNPSPTSIFPVRFPVSDALRKKLTVLYERYRDAWKNDFEITPMSSLVFVCE